MKKTKGLVTVRCECGDEILVLPDSKATGKAIDDHVDLHIRNLRTPSCTTAEGERLKDMLIAQVLSLASQIEEDD
jgi:hypothetical protein